MATTQSYQVGDTVRVGRGKADYRIFSAYQNDAGQWRYGIVKTTSKTQPKPGPAGRYVRYSAGELTAAPRA